MPNEKTINAAIQLLPLNEPNYLFIIDKAIECIAKSGLPFQVCAFETVIEGSLAAILQLVQEINNTAIQNGCKEIIINIKLHCAQEHLSLYDKTAKYRST